MPWTPPQSTELELLDASPAASEQLARNLREMTALHRWTGGAGLIWRALLPMLGPGHSGRRLLEVAAGDGSLGRWLARQAEDHGSSLEIVLSDAQPGVARICRLQTALPVVACDGLELPLADQSMDIVVCAQTLHHLAPSAVLALLREATRVARVGWIVADLRRSWPGYWGARLIGLGPMTALGRHDGPLSVLRAYTPSEMARLVSGAGLAGCELRTGPAHYALIWRRGP
jgi:hypothetical protein